MSVVYTDQPNSQLPANPSRKIPPGPRGKPIIGNLRDFRRDILGLLETSARAYGEIVHFRVGPREIFLLNDPYYIQHVLQTNSRNYRKGRALVRTKVLLGEGLLTSEGDLWLRQRRLIQPAFHRKRIAALGQMMTDCTLDMMAHWQPHQSLNVAEEMMGLTLNIVCKALFSTNISEEEQATVKEAMDVALKFGVRNATRPPFMEKMPTRENHAAKKAIHQLDGIVYQIIQERRQHSQADGMNDLLTMLMTATDADTGEAMNDRQLRDEVMTLFLAGHETTANALAWTWYLLSENPAAAEQLYAELDSVLNGRLPTMDDLPNLPYAQAVLQESMRLYPPAWVISRQAIGEDEIGGYPIPTGSAVIVSPYMMHRNPIYWENAERFDPTRFLNPQWRPHFSYFPFGGGSRQCIGMNFALMEAQLVLATVAQSYRLKLAEGTKVVPEALITLRPRDGVHVVIEPR